ncbi:MAG: insulinase family protein [Paenibacillaceae bacterium]|nr:insulinase family protein [Paenibacillaceae bacterium]
MEKRQLSSGVRVVWEHIPTVRSAAIGIWIKSGSRHETPETNGISHFIEHMLFKGTTTRSAKDIANAFDGIGGQVNAFTAKEYTCYYAKVLDEHIDVAVDVLADMFFHSAFDPQELEKEKNVILEEIAMYEDTPDDLVHDLVAQATYDAHPLARPILGTAERLHALDRSHLIAYVKHHYVAADIVISCAGQLDESLMDKLERTFDAARFAFAHFGVAHNNAAKVAMVPPTFASGHAWIQKQTEQHHVCLSYPGLALDDGLVYAMIVLNNVMGGGMSSRLFQTIREQRGLAYSVFSYHTAHEDSGTFAIYAGVAPKQTAEALDVVGHLVSEAIAKGLTDDELRRAKAQMKGSLILGLESAQSRMTRNGKNELMNRRLVTQEELMHNIDAVTHEHVRMLIDRVFLVLPATAIVGASEDDVLRWREKGAGLR